MPINFTDAIINIGQQSSQLDWNTLWTTLTNGLTTLLAAFLGSFVTFKIYQQDKKDKEHKEKELAEKEKVRNLNTLLIQMLQCISNTLTNISIVENQENIYLENYKNASIYALDNYCKTEIINDSVNCFVIELPAIVYNLDGLKDALDWAEKHRERRNNSITQKDNNEKYLQQSKIEKNWLIHIINLIIPNLLVVYDFATYNFKKEEYTILDISGKEFLKDSWKYLPEDFKKIDIESKLQYKFKDEAVVKWFFEVLKKEYEKEQEENQTQKEESITNEQEL